jgi:putative glutamine amidotransferase
MRFATARKIKHEREAYFTSIQRAGGEPVAFPMSTPVEQLPGVISTLKGIVLTGGGDIDPVLFDGQPHPKVYGIDAVRDQIEIELARYCADHRIPLFGICRGLQVINVALGERTTQTSPNSFPAH